MPPATSKRKSPVLRAFTPVEPPQATLLILGSMPGVASLEANAYYAHPRNAFWPIMQYILEEQCESYEERIALLKRNNIALWDVLQECRRPGSLDSNIINSSMVVNDFATFLQRQPVLKTIAFNGKAAEKMFRRNVVKTAEAGFRCRLNAINLISLPSSSPAMASLSLSEKQTFWRELLTNY